MIKWKERYIYMGMATNTIALMTIIVCILSRNWLIEYLSMIILWLYYLFKVQKILTLVFIFVKKVLMIWLRRICY